MAEVTVISLPPLAASVATTSVNPSAGKPTTESINAQRPSLPAADVLAVLGFAYAAPAVAYAWRASSISSAGRL